MVNYENAPAYRLSTEWNLYTSVVTSMLSDKYYETASNRLKMLQDLIETSDPQFVARLAIYARERVVLLFLTASIFFSEKIWLFDKFSLSLRSIKLLTIVDPEPSLLDNSLRASPLNDWVGIETDDLITKESFIG